MILDISALDTNVLQWLRTQTGLAVGDNDTPIPAPDVLDTFCILYNISTPGLTGGAFSDTNFMGDVTYQVSVIGASAPAVRAAAQRVSQVASEQWQMVPACMGPPTISRGAMLRDQERSYRTIVSLTMKGTGT